jgi:hypothetical protein
MIDRADKLRQFQFEWPALTAAFMLTVVRWLIAVVVIFGLGWLIKPRIARLTAGRVPL